MGAEHRKLRAYTFDEAKFMTEREALITFLGDINNEDFLKFPQQ